MFASCEVFYIFRSLWLVSYESLCMLWNMSSLELPLFLLSYLGRSLKHSGSSPWEVLGAWRSKYTVWFLNRKFHCERSHSWSEEHWCEQWRSLSLPVFWLIFNIRPSRVRTEGDCQETYPVKGLLGRWIQLKEACFWWLPGEEDYVHVIYYDVFLATMQACQCSMPPGPGQLES